MATPIAVADFIAGRHDAFLMGAPTARGVFIAHQGLAIYDPQLKAVMYHMEEYEEHPGNSSGFRWVAQDERLAILARMAAEALELKGRAVSGSAQAAAHSRRSAIMCSKGTSVPQGGVVLLTPSPPPLNNNVAALRSSTLLCTPLSKFAASAQQCCRLE